MTNKEIQELFAKQDNAINKLSISVETLINSQVDLNEILKNQIKINTKFESLDRELKESFDTVKRRVTELEKTQKSESGCNSVHMLKKDVEKNSEDTKRLDKISETNRDRLDDLIRLQAGYPSTTAIRWVLGVAVAYSISFGVYVVQSLNELHNTDAKVVTLLERNIKDTTELHLELKKLNGGK